jgi:hypothetical protein
MPIDRITAKGQLVALHFEQADVSGTQSAVALATSEVRDSAAAASDQNAAVGYCLPFGYDIVAISVTSSAARTAGTLTVDATIGGTVTGLQAVLNGTTTNNGYGTASRGTYVGAAGDKVGVKITTASWTPTTADIAVTVWCIVQLDGI